ncbi:MAG TPA: SDR family oxidoreductase [Steroidobacteraceae bacterium]|nr:SDR family oxidoreductase [Steroidobacteraceae bacterium]
MRFVITALCALLLATSSMGPATLAADDLQSGASPSASPTVLITGASRGLGFEFARQYAELGWNVVATVRDPARAAELDELKKKHPSVYIEKMDVTDHASVDALARKLEGRPIDVLLNNAGVFGNPGDFRLGSIKFEEFDAFFRTNALGPLKVSEAFLPHVKASAHKKIVAVSSLAGSFAARGGGMPGHYFYKGSKAALNMFIVTLAGDTKKDGIIVTALSPGMVDTRGGAMKGMPGLTEIDASISGMIKVIDGLTPEQSGTWIRYTGEPAAW